MARDYVAVPYEYETEMDMLTDAEFGQLIKALIRYSRDGEKINLSNNAQFYAKRVMKREDYYKSGYSKMCETNRQNGSMGGRPKKTEENPEKPKETERNRKNPEKPTETERNRQKPTETQKTQNKNKKENEDKKDVSKETITPLSPLDGRSSELREAVNKWLVYKKEKQQAYKPMGLKQLVTQILSYCDKYGDSAVVDVINRTMANSYQGIGWYWLDKEQQQTKPQAVTVNQQGTSTTDRLIDMIKAGEFSD